MEESHKSPSDSGMPEVDPEDLGALAMLRTLVPPFEEDASLLGQVREALETTVTLSAAQISWERGTAGKGGLSFSFPSPRLWGDATDEVVPGTAWLAEPSLQGRDALVALHPGFTSDLAVMRVLTRFLRDGGFDVYAPWAPHHGPRNKSGFPSGAPLVGRGAAGMILSVMRGEVESAALILGLQARGYRRILVTGASLGGLVAALAVSRVAVDGAALLIPATDFQTELWPAVSKSESVPEVRQLLDRGFAAIHAARRSPAPGTDPKSIHVMAAARDGVCRLSHVRRFCAAWGVEPPVELDCGHLGFFARWADARTHLSEWFLPAR